MLMASKNRPEEGHTPVDVFYTKAWSEEDKVKVRQILESHGLDVAAEGEYGVKSATGIPPTLLIDIGEEVQRALVDGTVTLLIFGPIAAAIHQIWHRFGKHEGQPAERDARPDIAVELTVTHNVRYVVPAEEAIDQIEGDFKNSAGREGERYWKDGRWQTFEEMYPDWDK